MYVYYQRIIVKRNNKITVNWLRNKTLFYNINFGLHKLYVIPTNGCCLFMGMSLCAIVLGTCI